VKSNTGHTQAAAGVAGVIKTVLALGHGELPRTLHAQQSSPHIDWAAGNIQLLTDPVPWPGGSAAEGGRPRRAGVSAFGLSGTNAHVIIADPPDLTGESAARADDQLPVADSDPESAPPAVADAGAAGAEPAPAVLGPAAGVTAWLVSARSASALTAQAGRLADWVRDRPGLNPGDVAWSLATSRATFEHRAVVTGAGGADLAAGAARTRRGGACRPGGLRYGPGGRPGGSRFPVRRARIAAGRDGGRATRRQPRVRRGVRPGLRAAGSRAQAAGRGSSARRRG
jgi:acyl transferase domain-containing protein